jgi:hypothetical protein
MVVTARLLDPLKKDSIPGGSSTEYFRGELGAGLPSLQSRRNKK